MNVIKSQRQLFGLDSTYDVETWFLTVGTLANCATGPDCGKYAGGHVLNDDFEEGARR